MAQRAEQPARAAGRPRAAGRAASRRAGDRPPRAAGRPQPPAGGSGRSFVPCGAALALLLVLAALLVQQSLGLTGGRLTYALDDPYIHMAMAKNLAEHGVWGVTRYGFTSATSSPLWTLLLGGVYTITGATAVVPLILNLLAGGLVILSASRILAGPGPRRLGWVAVVLLALVLCVPLCPLVMTGQEHLLHLLLVLLFAGAAARRFTGGEAAAGGLARAAFWVLPPLLTLVRYESLFVVFPVVLMLAARRQWRAGLLLGLLAVAAPLGYGIFCLQHGWALIPNPILSKAHLPGGDPAEIVKTLSGYLALRRLFVHPHLLLPVLGALAWLAAGRRAPSAGDALARPLLLIFLAATALHLTFADLGWFYRYEAYLVGLGIVGLGRALLEGSAGAAAQTPTASRWRRPAAVVLGLLFLVAIGDRGVRAALEAPRATANIYEQQVQMGRFLARYYPGAPVAINDIGAANFLADIRCLDLFGLAEREVLDHIRNGTYGVKTIDRLARAHGARVVIVHPNWIRAPASWERVGSWTIRKNLVCGGDTIAFYALDRAGARVLIERLRAFAPELPSTIQQRGAYVEVG